MTANKFSYLVEDFFNLNFSHVDEKFGKTMKKETFFSTFKNHFDIEVTSSELEELWSAVKITENSEVIHFFEWRLNFSFINEFNPEVNSTKIFQKLKIFSDEEA